MRRCGRRRTSGCSTMQSVSPTHPMVHHPRFDPGLTGQAMHMNPHHDADLWGRLADATCFALSIHARQTRKGSGIPYIAHLLGVASLVLEHGGDEEQAIAGLLHDAIEDAGAQQESVIADRFGPRVAGMVRDCTDADTLPKPPWRARKEAYIAHLESVGSDALLVSASDKLHNARAICTDLRIHGVHLQAESDIGGLALGTWPFSLCR